GTRLRDPRVHPPGVSPRDASLQLHARAVRRRFPAAARNGPDDRRSVTAKIVLMADEGADKSAEKPEVPVDEDDARAAAAAVNRKRTLADWGEKKKRGLGWGG